MIKFIFTLFFTIAVTVGYSVAGDYTGLSVHRILEPGRHKVTPGGQVWFWREVCVSQDISVLVHRIFVNIKTGRRYAQPSVTYGMRPSSIGCEAVLYQVEVPSYLPLGYYEYQPTGEYVIDDRRYVVDLPVEYFYLLE